MKKFIFILIATLLSFGSILAQSNNNENELTAKISYAKYPGPMFTVYGKQRTYNNYRLEVNYDVLKFFEIGCHLGYSKTIVTIDADQNPFLFVDTWFFGLNINIQLLPIISNKDLPVGLYVFGRYGGFWLPSPEGSYPNRGVHKEIRHGIGLETYLVSNFGLFSEFSIEKISSYDGTFRFGVCYKF